jgi:hypothetical protein
LTVDGASVTVSERILVLHEATVAYNGAYTVTQVGDASHPYVLTRATDFNQAAAGNIATNAYFFVAGGSANLDTGWVMTTSGTITVGTTALTFTQFSASTPYAAGSGLTLTGNVFAIAPSVALGAASSTDKDIAVFSGTTGNQLADPAMNYYRIVEGPATSGAVVPGNVPKFATASDTYTQIVDSGLALSGIASPFLNAKVANNGCAAAAGDGSTDDSAAIQCNLTWLFNHGGAGVLYLPYGVYEVGTTLALYGNTTLRGANRSGSWIRVSGPFSSLTVQASPTSGPTCNPPGNLHAKIEDVGFIGYQSASPQTNNVVITAGCSTTIVNANVWYGYSALRTSGSDSYVIGSSISGYAYGVNSDGNNWYVQDQIDYIGAGFNTIAAFYQDTPYCGGCYENHLVEVDLQPWAGGFPLEIQDGSGTDVTTVTGSIFGGGGTLYAPGGQALLMDGDEFGVSVVFVNSGGAVITASWPSASLSFTGSVSVRGCANIRITTPGGCGP